MSVHNYTLTASEKTYVLIAPVHVSCFVVCVSDAPNAYWNWRQSTAPDDSVPSRRIHEGAGEKAVVADRFQLRKNGLNPIRRCGPLPQNWYSAESSVVSILGFGTDDGAVVLLLTSFFRSYRRPKTNPLM